MLAQKNKWLSARIHITSQFQLPTKQPNRFHLFTEIKSSSIPHAEIKLISTAYTKIKLSSMIKL